MRRFKRYSERRGGSSAQNMGTPNMTSLIDVMFTLLVMFMIATPLMTVTVPVDLPKTEAASSNVKQDKEPLIVSIDAKSVVYLQETKIDLLELPYKLKAVTNSNPDARIFVRGDKTLSYGKIMEVMGAIRSAGYSKVALVADIPTIDMKKGGSRSTGSRLKK